ncbi:MAG: signal transduction histidine kinase, LytS [Bacteroidetes bacterium]|jgi:tetratricopeptide (TPR) repeat protein|nr:signal transduction histidine kinase, LytS [Bacteroidota bacterium]
MRWINKGALLFILILVLFSHNSRAQQRDHNTDSLFKVYNSHTHDTDRIKALIFLSWNLRADDPARSEKYVAEAFQKASVLKNERLIAEALHVTANNYFLRNDFVKAVEYNILALKSHEKNGNKIGMADDYNNLGTVYQIQDRLKEALECYEKAMTLYATANERSKASSLGNIGVIYERLGNSALAEKYLQEALRIEKKFGEIKHSAETIQNLGNVALNNNRLPDAKELFERALFIFDSIGDVESKYNCLTAIAVMYFETGHLDESATYALKVRSLIKGTSSLKELENVYGIMMEHAKKKNDYKLATVYSDSLLMVMAKIYSEEISLQSAELLKKYETEKMARENAALKEEKTQLEMEASRRNILLVFSLIVVAFIIVFTILYMRQKRFKEMQRSTELEQKVLRAQMNPHFIFNALNAIQRLYLEKKQEKADEYMGDFGQLLRKILDNSGKSMISLHEELTSLSLYLNLEKNRLEDKMEYELTGHEELDIHHMLVPPLILQPVVENAIWHGIAPKGKGKIKISCALSNNKLLTFTIEDDGVGIQSNDNAGNGTHVSKGLKLTVERLKPLGSVTMLPGDNNIGTKVIMHIPYKTG